MNKTEYQLGNRSHQYCTSIYGNAQCSIDLVHLKTNLQLPARERENKKKKKRLVYERGRACVGWVGMEGGCDPTRRLVDTTFFHRQAIYHPPIR